jgi:cytochrome b561
MSDTADRYDRVQITLHWLIAAGILTMIVLGLFMVQLPRESELPPGQESVRAFWFLLHKSLGLTIAMFIVLRVGWRLTHKAPPLPDYLPNWQQRVSRASHGLLYVLMVAMPLSGYAQSMFSKYPTKFWGIELPRLADASDSMREVFSEVHEVLAFTLIALLLIHIGAAIKHRLEGNDMHKRMSLFDKSA